MPKLTLKLFFFIAVLTGLQSVYADEASLETQQATTNESITQKLNRNIKNRNYVIAGLTALSAVLTLGGGVLAVKAITQKVQERKALKEKAVKEKFDLKDLKKKGVCLLTVYRNETNGKRIDVTQPYWSFKAPTVTVN